ncbi:YLP motif-containing protein 1-like [Engraulis encrasicolus]|uniref:YLP motif-containing protein 1-like n=1 Tax=Engraulis encrasicolus TaxID=184585 RepID=UPI002FD2144A
MMVLKRNERRYWAYKYRHWSSQWRTILKRLRTSLCPSLKSLHSVQQLFPPYCHALGCPCHHPPFGSSVPPAITVPAAPGSSVPLPTMLPVITVPAAPGSSLPPSTVPSTSTAPPVSVSQFAALLASPVYSML